MRAFSTRHLNRTAPYGSAFPLNLSRSFPLQSTHSKISLYTQSFCFVPQSEMLSYLHV